MNAFSERSSAASHGRGAHGVLSSPTPDSRPPTPAPGWAQGAARATALVCFLFSGFCGLVYEVVWTRMLTQVFGNTTYAIATVLSAFMAGLAIGTMTRKMSVKRPAPSTLTASTMSSLICRNASRMRKVPRAETA